MKTSLVLLSIVSLSRAVVDTNDEERRQRSVETVAEPVNQIPTTYSEHVAPFIVQQGIPFPVRTPYAVAVQIPVRVPSPVPVEVQVPVPYVKTLTVPYDKEVPVPVIKEIPVPVYRDVEVPVIRPYPVSVPVYKTRVIDHGTKHTYEQHQPRHSWW